MASHLGVGCIFFLDFNLPPEHRSFIPLAGGSGPGLKKVRLPRHMSIFAPSAFTTTSRMRGMVRVPLLNSSTGCLWRQLSHMRLIRLRFTSLLA